MVVLLVFAVMVAIAVLFFLAVCVSIIVACVYCCHRPKKNERG